jgi:hypothetical protein
MKIPLLSYERRTLESLEAKFGLERELTVGIAEDLSSLAHLFEEVVTGQGCSTLYT